MVAHGGADQHHHHAAPGHRLAVVFHVAGHVPCDVRCGGFVAQQFLDRLRNQCRVLDEFALWSGCSANTLPAQPISRVVVSLPAPATTLR